MCLDLYAMNMTTVWSNYKMMGQMMMMGHREWPVDVCSGRQDDRPPARYMHRQATLPDASSGLWSKQTFRFSAPVRFHYTLLDVWAEFSCVYGNNHRMLLYKKIHILPTSEPGLESCPGLPTGILKCQITQIWHFWKAFGSEKLALAVWHIFGIILTTLAVKFLDWQ